MVKSLLKIFIMAVAVVMCGCSYGAQDDLMAEYDSSVMNIANEGSAIVVSPKSAPVAGFVFYPGASVSYESYLPLMIKCAKKGIECVLVQMPEDYAMYDASAAGKYIAEHTEVSDWYVGGHSLGGAMVSTFAAAHSSVVKGVVLMASYSTADISGLKVLCVYGSNDGVMNRENYESYRKNLPSDFTEKVIEGGNHSGFAKYGPQSGDNEASISKDQQMNETADAMYDFMTN